jgi:prolyl oligopeptidase
MLNYPEARRDDVADDFHGTRVPDPYRWLEDPENPDARAWVEAENALTASALGAYAGRDAIHRRLTELWDYPRTSVPRREGGRYFFSRNNGLQNQAVLYVQESLDAEPRVVLDPNALSEDGTIALTNTAYSHDGTLLAYGTSSGGSDWQEIRVRRVDEGADFPELIRWCKFAGIAWKHDGSGFFYNRLPEPGSVPPEDASNYWRVYWHQLGTDQADDRLVFEQPEAKELIFHPFITDDGAYLLLHVSRGTDPTNRIYYRPVEGDGPFVRLLDENDARYEFVDNVGARFFFHTDAGAPRGRIVAIDLDRPGREHWQEIVPERGEVLSFAAVAGERLAVAYMRDAHHKLRLFELGGREAGEIALPALGTVSALHGRRGDEEMLIGFESFLFPPLALRYDVASGELKPFRKTEVDFPFDDYETRQVFYTSRDGTRVPMFLTHRRGLELSGDNPVWLYGYGGFNVDLLPYFAPSRLLWLERGGVLAVANLRGGGEYGEPWHRAGMLEKKQNVFDDFIAAGEWLIASGYTRPERLAINGGSNGGLLVAACMLQRPELFGAVVCQVPVIDMLRYHRFTIGRYWAGEYGNAEESAEHFAFMIRYSPLHNVRPGVRYPPTLILAADTDDRVVPAHAKKFAATLQRAYPDGSPILLRIETRAGHGLGKPTAKVIEELADIYTFLFQTFQM